jgi:hypothetical protein
METEGCSPLLQTGERKVSRIWSVDAPFTGRLTESHGLRVGDRVEIVGIPSYVDRAGSVVWFSPIKPYAHVLLDGNRNATVFNVSYLHRASKPEENL